MAHTPGPWKVQESDHGQAWGGYWQIDAESDTVACNQYCSAGYRSKEVSLANARLIAAAPDLLSIAKRWAALDGGAWAVERHAREKAELLNDTLLALDKAEGR